MASQPESSVTSTAPTAPALEVLNDSRGDNLSGYCGPVTVNLYFGLISSKGHHKSSIKCIFSNFSWLSSNVLE